MKQPLAQNLALNFLFKDQDLSEIIKLRFNDGTQQTAASHRDSTSSRMSESSSSQLNTSSRESVSEFADQEQFRDLTKIPGYYKKKISNDITSVQEFVNKVYKSQVLSKFFSQSDTNFAGITDLFQELYTKLSQHILADGAMMKEHRLHIKEINEFIMFQLHSEFFNNQQPS